jgi:hypothetical protein
VKTAATMTLVLLAAYPAAADFSYTQTRKSTGGMISAGGPQTSKVALKGGKIRTETGHMAIILDADSQTVTTIDNDRKTYSVKPFGEATAAAGNVGAKIDVKETGETRTVNGFQARELVMSIEVDSPQTALVGKMQMEIDMWLSSDVPGAKEMVGFYQQNGGKMPWGAMAGQGNPQMASALAEVQRKISSMKGVPVQQIVKVKAPAGAMPARASAGPSVAQMQQMQAGMEKARAHLEAMAAGGGPAAAIAQQQLARMGPSPGGAGAASATSSGSLLEMTIDSSDFSTAAVPDSLFAIPVGYQKN